MNNYKYKNTYENDFESFVYEECSICGVDMTDTKDIWTEKNSDNYVCHNCVDTYSLDAVRCAEY